VSFSAIALCLDPQRVFIAARVNAIRDFIRADLSKRHIFINFGFKLWRKCNGKVSKPHKSF